MSTTRATVTTRPGRTSSTSTTLCAATTHCHDIVFRLYINNADLPLDFSSVGRTGSRRASGHCVLQCDYSSSGLHRLYCAYALHPDAPSRRSTSRRSVALAIAVRLAARLLIVRIAPALMRLCRAS
jgi:hypothetical protein